MDAFHRRFRLLTPALLFAVAACSGRAGDLAKDVAVLVPSAPAPAKVAEAESRAVHPLDPLTAAEIAAARVILREAKHVDDASRFAFVALREPAKAEVIEWRRKRGAFPRRAFAAIRDRGKVYEAVVDLIQRKVDSYAEIHGVQASFLLEEFMGVGDIVKADAGWQAAMKKRGFESFDAVACMPLSAGYFDVPEEKGRRLVRVPCFDGRSTRNVWGRPIDGLLAVVDLGERKVMKLVDGGIVPIPEAPAEYPRRANASAPARVAKPGFEVKGHEVRWERWRLHARLDARAGLVVSMVAWDDGDKVRPILYQGNVAELFVPYMDPDPLWYFRSYLDMGEYGLGKLTSTLITGVDCPPNAVYLGDAQADDVGAPQVREQVVCFFERATGDVAWRHYDFLDGTNESRTSRELVARSVATIGNYDYVFDWIFRQDGTIRVNVGATGVAEVKAVVPRGAASPGGAAATAYGHFVADHTVAVNHDHFMSYRLDFDVDGTKNSLVVDEIHATKSPQGPRKSLWTARSRVAKRESEAKLHMSMEHPALWRVINPDVSKVGGSPTSYELHAGHTAMSLLSADDFPQKRGGFTAYSLWATAYDPRERHAAGDYPNQSPGGEGLPAWTAKDRPLEGTDLVLWYTLGFHHVVRAEDWPVMPTSTHGFELRPFDFFPRNPALDLP